MKIIVYTFRTFPQIPLLQKEFGNVFVFGKLKADFLEFRRLMDREKPQLIIGIANSPTTRIETKAINQFNSGRINSKAKTVSYDLLVPEGLPFKLATESGFSFCNWTMYKISEVLPAEAKLMFCHINLKDLPSLVDYIRLLQG